MKNMLNQNGFTFLAALMVVVIMGIMLGLTAQPWKTIMKREREQELLFRGLQYKKAIAAWNTRPATPGATPKVIPLNDLKDLLLDPSSLQKTKYLRRLYKDPMTGKEWTIIKDMGGKGIIGVASTSEKHRSRHLLRNTPALIPLPTKKNTATGVSCLGLIPGRLQLKAYRNSPSFYEFKTLKQS